VSGWLWTILGISLGITAPVLIPIVFKKWTTNL
jgi:hypothetical protein